MAVPAWTLLHFITAKWDPPIASHMLESVGGAVPPVGGLVTFRRTRLDGRPHRRQWVQAKVEEVIPLRYYTGHPRSDPTHVRDDGHRFYVLVTILSENDTHYGDRVIPDMPE